NEGRVSLRGPILARELDEVVGAVSHVRGVRHVDVQLEPHGSADVPRLQGGARRQGARGILPLRGPPPARLPAGAAGLSLVAAGLRRGVAGLALTAPGLPLFARAATNRRLGRSGAAAAGALELQKSLHVRAPIEAVFAAWRDFT